MVQAMLDSLTSSLTPSDPPTSHMATLLACDHKLGSNYKSILKRPSAGEDSMCTSCDKTTPEWVCMRVCIVEKYDSKSHSS